MCRRFKAESETPVLLKFLVLLRSVFLLIISNTRSLKRPLFKRSTLQLIILHIDYIFHLAFSCSLPPTCQKRPLSPHSLSHNPTRSTAVTIPSTTTATQITQHASPLSHQPHSHKSPHLAPTRLKPRFPKQLQSLQTRLPKRRSRISSHLRIHLQRRLLQR